MSKAETLTIDASLVTFLGASALAIAAVLALAPLARRAGWTDKPNVRKTHEGEIPLVGGWAILLALVLTQALIARAAAPAGYWVGALLLFTVAVVDDRYPIRARYRFAAQCAAAVAAIWLGGSVLPHLGDLFGTGRLDEWWLVIPVSVIGIVSVVNAFNLTDGADGLCGGLAFIALACFAAALYFAAGDAASSGIAQAAPHARSLVPLCITMVGALGGFLIFNLRTPWRRRAAVFLGDSGSMLVGFTVAWVAVHVASAYGAASVSPVVCLWIVAVPLADAASCFVRRILAGETPMTADLKHLHHLLAKLGLSTARAVSAIHAGGAVCGLIGVAGWRLGLDDSTLFAGFAVALGVFIAMTNLAWRRIDEREAALQAA